MNCSILHQSSRNRLYLIFLIGFLCASAFSNWQTAQMQVKPLSLVDIINGLQAEQVTLERRNKILTDGVKERRVDFTIGPEIEKALRGLGASNELLEAIRQNGPKPKIVSTPTPAPTPDAAFYLSRGNNYAVKGEYDRAISDYNEAIRLNPQDAVAFYSRGIAYHYKNSGERAFEDYKTAVQLNPELASQPTLQCVLYNSTTTENPDKAIEECSKIITQSSDFALAYYIRGNAYRDKKETDRAIADYDKFIELNPKHISAYINRGDVYFDKKDYDRAAADYNQVIELDATNELAKINLQRLQTEQAQVSKKEPVSSSSGQPNTPQTVNVGALNERAVKLIIPVYPSEARRIGVQGKVVVQISLDENGNVVSAKATSGNGLLYPAAEDAARRSKFKPVVIDNQTVKAIGFIIYIFNR